MNFTQEQIKALRTLARLWSTERFVLIEGTGLDAPPHA
jgi:hypothetical protein